MAGKIITHDILNQYGSEIKDYIDRVVGKKVLYDTTANWNSQISFIPEEGTVIVYSDYKTIIIEGVEKTIAGIKIGDGRAYLIDLPFVDEDVRMALIAHINDANVHIQEGEREFWNNKLNYTLDENSGTLEFNRR